MLVFEDTGAVRRRRLFTLLGVDWLATPYAWLSVPFFAALGTAAAFGLARSEPLEARLVAGLGYGLLLYLAHVLHALGHIVSGKWAGAPMDANLLTATFHVNLYYGDQSAVEQAVHTKRALGGPALNLLSGLIAVASGTMVQNGFLAFFAFASIAFGAFVLLPIPSLDGGVIWGELLGLRRLHRP
jgi:membrane-associated protease RseP (regulator of RpoE activity)